MKKLNKKGVSLAELLAVVVIMGIIAAIAIPLVGNVIETSKKKAFVGDLVTIAEAARTYCLVEGKDSDGLLCDSDGSTQFLLLNKGKKNGASTLIDGEATKLQAYISKPLKSIGDVIKIKRTGETYEVLVGSFVGGYSTGTVAGTAPASVETYVNPIEEATIDNVVKSTAPAEP